MLLQMIVRTFRVYLFHKWLNTYRLTQYFAALFLTYFKLHTDKMVLYLVR